MYSIHIEMLRLPMRNQYLHYLDNIREFLQQENQFLAEDGDSLITPYLDLDEEAIEFKSTRKL